MTTRPAAPSHEVVVLSDFPVEEEHVLREQCYAVRSAVFCAEQGFSAELEVDGLDASATHLLLRLVPAGTPIGTLRFYPSAPSADYTIGRVVVLQQYRACGFGGVLIRAAHARIVADHARVLADHARIFAGAAPTRPEPEIPASGDTAKSELAPAAAGPGAAAPRTVSVKLGSQIPAMGFYARYGYVPEGEQYLDEGSPHRYMRVHLPLEPPSTHA